MKRVARAKRAAKTERVAPAIPTPAAVAEPAGESETSETVVGATMPMAPLVAGYLFVHSILVVWGMQLADSTGITPWYPAAGLALAAIIIGGERWIAVTLIGTLIAAGLLHGTGGHAGAIVGSALAVWAVYAVAGMLLRRVLDRRRPMARVSDAWWMIGVGAVGAPAVAGALFVGVRALADGSLPAPALEMVRTFVLGNGLGTLSVAPGVIVLGTAMRRFGVRGTRVKAGLLGPESLAALAALAALTPAVYFGAAQDLRAVAALPLCWLALRFGVAGAVLGAFTWASSSALVLVSFSSGTDFAGMQAFLLTGTMLALIVGAVVSERELTQRELRYLALHDRESGLPNEPHLIALIDEARQDAGGREVTTMMIRFAGLRQVAAALRKTDTDQLIASLADTITAIAGDAAQIARPGFDRFAVLITGAGADRRQAIAEQLISELGQPLAVESREVFVDPRVGITVGASGEAGDVIMAHAVHAADVAASAQNSRIGYYDASIERAHRDRQELTEDLRAAVERGEFLLAFQPIVTAKEGRVVAAEALLRWVDQKRGPVSPMDFIPVAEETGLILPIGRWVLNEACRRAASWPHVAGKAIDVSVNVSPIQLMDEGFVDDVADALRQSGLPAERLRVEITEGIVLEDIERTILRIRQLREMGVATMLDDFGTGHSSLAWVQRLPVSCIKIDRAFVRDVAVDGIDRAIVHASLYLSRALGTETIAEGVETEAQREQLVRMGCQKLQGYLFARPQPADVFPDWLAKQRSQAVRPAPPRTRPGAPARPRRSTVSPGVATPEPHAVMALAEAPAPAPANAHASARAHGAPQPPAHGLTARPQAPVPPAPPARPMPAAIAGQIARPVAPEPPRPAPGPTAPQDAHGGLTAVEQNPRFAA